MKLCCVFNYNPLYRLPIFKAMDESLGCDFFFGDTVFQNIERFDATQLKGFQGYIHAKRLIRGHIWHSGIKRVFSRKYTHYLLTGSSNYLVNWLIYLYAFFTRKKVYLWTHGINSPIKKWWSRLHCKLFYLPADGIFLYGNHAIPYMEDIGCKREKLHIIHNSLDTNRQTELYESGLESMIYQEHFNNSYPVAIYIGRLQKTKRIDELLHAIAICRNIGSPVNLVIVGPMEDDDTLSDLISELELDSFVWLFGGTYEEIVTSELLFNANVCVCPGAIGLTAVHSLSYGTPVITNNDFNNQGPEHETILEGISGSFYRKGDAEDLSNHIHKWCSVSYKERQSIRNQARDSILREWSVIYQIELLKRVLQH